MMLLGVKGFSRVLTLGLMGFGVTGCFDQGFSISKSTPVKASVASASDPLSSSAPSVFEPVVPTALSPKALDDGPFEIAQNQTLKIDPADLMKNDYDPGKLSLLFDGFEAVSVGSLQLSANQLIFTPPQDYSGAASFKYRIKNSQNLSAVATVTINVRRAAVEPMYGQTSSTLYRFDVATLTATSIANFHLQDGRPVGVYDIAITPSGLMYGVDGSSLYYIDAQSGVLTQIVADFSSSGDINGLTSLSDGRLVISGNGVATYDIVSKTVRTLLAPGSYQSAGDIIALPDGFLYFTANGPGSDQLIRVDPSTSAVKKIGDVGISGIYGLGYENHLFYGFAGDGSVFEIDSSTAKFSNRKTTPNVWYGATTNPVKWQSQ